MADGMGLGRRRVARALAFNIADDQPAQVCGAGAALVLRLDIEVLNVLVG